MFFFLVLINLVPRELYVELSIVQDTTCTGTALARARWHEESPWAVTGRPLETANHDSCHAWNSVRPTLNPTHELAFDEAHAHPDGLAQWQPARPVPVHGGMGPWAQLQSANPTTFVICRPRVSFLLQCCHRRRHPGFLRKPVVLRPRLCARSERWSSSISSVSIPVICRSCRLYAVSRVYSFVTVVPLSCLADFFYQFGGAKFHISYFHWAKRLTAYRE